MVAENLISGKLAKDVLDIEWTERRRPRSKIVEARGMKQVTDTGAIEKAVDAVIAANPDKVEEVKTKPKLARMVRRSGDEVDRRKSKSRRRQRDPQDATRSARRGVICDICKLSRLAARKSRNIDPCTECCI